MNALGLGSLSTVFLLLPFVLGWIHSRNKGDNQYALITYRYFVLFNVVLSGLSVCARTLATHLYNPSHDMVIAAILAMVIVSGYAIWQQGSIKLAPAFVWGLFVLFGAAFHGLEIMNPSRPIENLAMLWVHIAYDLLVFAILFSFFIRLNKRLKNQVL